MGIFSSIMAKIFHGAEGAVENAVSSALPGASAPAAAPAVQSTPVAPTPATPAAPAPTAAPSQPVDVEAVLTQMASQKGGGGNWRSSIVDLLKLLDLDSSLDARKQLAGELNVHVGADGTAEENVALHKAVMQKLAENGGTVPDSLKG
jgi:3-oxoacyl-ACP reductase-like protein